jgi:phage-related tail protein
MKETQAHVNITQALINTTQANEKLQTKVNEQREHMGRMQQRIKDLEATLMKINPHFKLEADGQEQAGNGVTPIEGDDAKEDPAQLAAAYID